MSKQWGYAMPYLCIPWTTQQKSVCFGDRPAKQYLGYINRWSELEAQLLQNVHCDLTHNHTIQSFKDTEIEAF